MTPPQLSDEPLNALHELLKRSADRGQSEDDISAEFDTAAQDLDRTIRQSRERIEQQYSEDRRDLDAEASRRRSEIEQTYQQSKRDAEAKAQELRNQIREELDTAEETLRHKLQEAEWITESVYEANEHLPQEEYEQAVRVLSTHEQELTELHDDVSGLLSRYGVESTDSRPIEPSQLDDVRTTDDALEDARQSVQQLRALRLPRFLAGPLVWILGIIVLAAGAGGGYVAAENFEQYWLYVVPGATLAAYLGFFFALRSMAQSQVRSIRDAFIRHTAEAEARINRDRQRAADRCERQETELRETRDRDLRQARDKYGPPLETVQSKRTRRLGRLESRHAAAINEIEQRYQNDLAALESDIAQRRDSLDQWYAEQTDSITQRESSDQSSLAEQRETRWADVRRTWNESAERLLTGLNRANALYDQLCPPWDSEHWTDWQPSASFPPGVRIGELHVDLAQAPGGLPRHDDLVMPDPAVRRVPVTMTFPDRGHVLIRTDHAGREKSLDLLQAVMLRVLTTIPPGKARFTIFDPIGLGQNFAGFMHLADYDGAYVSDRIWTETRHLEQRLSDLTEHMENVIQKYLRNEFETIDDYNEQAGEIAEPYRFLVIADLPNGFNDTCARRLASIVNSGPRCGVHVLISQDVRERLPSGLQQDQLEQSALRITWQDDRFLLDEDELRDFPLTVDDAPGEQFLTDRLHRIGRAAQEAGRVEVPFEMIAPKEDRIWTGRTSDDLHVPIGRAGASKLQQLALGRGTSQHVLIAGKTGSGKSTLLHALITSLAMWYSPHEVEFYLVDFKKGVEFKTYATHHLPHARVVAIESDREFGLSVLHRLDAELKRRGELFRRVGAQDLAAYRRSADAEPMPRTLLMIDEFQEFFTEDDKIAQDAALLMDRLVRQGRAFGMHVLLGSQTLGGAYSLARSTIGQMAVRIALQCSESDAYLIMNEDNAAARLLSRPGEAIYNDASGRIEGNSPFQVVWLPEDKRERYLHTVARMADETGLRPAEPPIVFEGNVPADIADNQQLARLLDAPDWANPHAAYAWLGEAIAIKGPTAVPLRPQSGDNTIIVGQQDEFAMAMTVSSLLSLAAQHDPDHARFVILDGTPADDPNAGVLNDLAEQLPHDVYHVQWREVSEAVSELADQVDRRAESSTASPAVYIFVHGLHRFRMLRRSESDFGFSMDGGDKPPAPDKQFTKLLRDGPPHGIHCLVWCDSATNLNRTVDRAAMREFSHRVLFQMSGSDSSELIDSPAAAKLGMKRALYANEEGGTIEKFRPYAMPEKSWRQHAVGRLARRISGATDAAH